MGFISSASGLTLTAKLTPIGREKLLTYGINTITKFSLGDSDANYNVEYPLTSGQVPGVAGDIGPTTVYTGYNTTNHITLRSKLIYNSLGALTKPVDLKSTKVTTYEQSLGLTGQTGSSLTHIAINRNNTLGTASTYTNLFFTLGLPISETDKAYFSSLTQNYGGFADTAISGVNQDNIVVIAIPTSGYGEVLDGKTMKVHLQNSGFTGDCYGTYRAGLTSVRNLDAEYRETDTTFNVIGNNVTFLFSDTVQRPNASVSKSWSTGWNTYKPFSVNKKELFNYVTNTNMSKTADTAVGIAYLDKGMIVLTHPSIVSGFTATDASATTVEYNSFITNVEYNIICICNRGEFKISNNPTFASGDVPRITEVALYDSTDNLIAIAKTDRQLEVPGSSFAALTIRIVL